MSDNIIPEKTPKQAAIDLINDYDGNIVSALDAANSGVWKRSIDYQHQLRKQDPFGDTDHTTLKNNMLVGINEIIFYSQVVEILVKELELRSARKTIPYAIPLEKIVEAINSQGK